MHLCIMCSLAKCTSLVESHKAPFLHLFSLHYTIMTLLLVCTSSTSRLFADDTCFILQHKNLADLNVKTDTEKKL